MFFWTIIKNLKIGQIWHLFVLFLQHPLFMFATVKATFLTMKITQKEFPDIHKKNNKANAFRHALWNILIAKFCNKFSLDLDTILEWTKKITDWHEEFSTNKKMAKLMDLHNNAIGRKRFTAVGKQTISNLVNILKDELSNAVLVKNKSEFKNSENRLVYIGE